MRHPIQRAIVVGASSGIGEAMARQLAGEGAQVALVARRTEELERVANIIKGVGKGGVRVYPHDVRIFDETLPLFQRIVADLGGLDFIAYASGAMPRIEESEYSFEKDREMVEVNLLGAMAWFNPAAALFEAQHRGTLLGISSVAGERGRRVNPAYGTTKAALTAYLEALRNRLSRYGVNVVTAKPGFVDTAMTRGMKGLFWLVTAEDAARTSLALARRESGASGFVPWRWSIIAAILRSIPSFIFRRLNV
jgi:short-subunit dehydrogenase